MTFIPTKQFKILASAIVMLIVWLCAPRGGKAQGIPEPGLVMYGMIQNVDGTNVARLTAGTLTCLVQSNGGPVVTLTTNLQNINDQFSYLLVVPFETRVIGFGLSSGVLELTSGGMTFTRQAQINGRTARFVTPTQTSFTFASADRGKLERVDLNVAIPFPDSDGDGLPDWWENQHFAGNANPNADPDGDGYTNMQEYLAGTDPNNANSFLSFTNINAQTNGTYLLTWPSISNKTYSVYRSATLTTNLAGFYLIASNVLATPPTNSLLDTNAPVGAKQFYRLGVP